MKNPNSPWAKTKRWFSNRWSGEDYPGAEPRFHISLFAKDVATFCFLPVISIVLFKSCENATAPKKRSASSQVINRDASRMEVSKTQIIDFRQASSSSVSGAPRRSPGSLVRVKLMNVVETYANAPVHAQIVDAGLGRNLMGGTLIGDAVSDTNFERISITFKYARDPNREGIALPISARALSLDGTLGVAATKKEGFFVRSVVGSGNSAAQSAQGGGGSADFKEILFRALTAGLIQEFGTSAQVEKNRAQVLVLPASTEFFAELTDFFPGGGK